MACITSGRPELARRGHVKTRLRASVGVQVKRQAAQALGEPAVFRVGLTL